MGDATQTRVETRRYVQAACQARKTASVAVRADGEWRLCRCRLLGCNLNEGVLWAEYPTALWKSRPVELAMQQPLGFRFPYEDRRLTFLGSLRKIRSLKRGSAVQRAIEVSLPRDVKCENLRRSFRVQVDPDMAIEMVLWPTSMRSLADLDEAQSMFRARVTDLSVGGASITDLDSNPDWEVGDHLGLELQLNGEEPISLMAQLRRITRPADEPATYGLAFIGAETPRKTFTAQETLSRLISQQQRVQLERRIKAGA